MIDRSTVERFFAKVHIPTDKQQCWIWTASKVGGGYGQLGKRGGRSGCWMAHRFSYMLFNNCWHSPPEAVCHTCDVPACVNPTHLFAGNALINMHDMYAKKRTKNPWGNTPRGSQAKTAKLTEQQIHQIRELRSSTKLSYPAIGRMFGVAGTTVSEIIRGKNWRHLTLPTN